MTDIKELNEFIGNGLADEVPKRKRRFPFLWVSLLLFLAYVYFSSNRILQLKNQKPDVVHDTITIQKIDTLIINRIDTIFLDERKMKFSDLNSKTIGYKRTIRGNQSFASVRIYLYSSKNNISRLRNLTSKIDKVIADSIK